VRQIVLDTETTGLDWQQGHRVIEIGCVEILHRRRTTNSFHCYLNPERDIDPGAQEIHGLSLEFLSDKPAFADIAGEFLDYLGDAELIIHNAPFDLGFLDYELREHGRTEVGPLSRTNPVLDTLVLARQQSPGQRNSLDALCKRYGIDNSRRDRHGALLDAELLADVYLAMTGGQTRLSLDDAAPSGTETGAAVPNYVDRTGLTLITLQADDADRSAHEAHLDMLDKSSDGKTVWRRVDYLVT
jgi:DNA polymerase-3 subunit epsilon